MSNNNRQMLNTVTGFIMIIMLVIFLLTGCSTSIPVAAKFPDAPERIKVKCPQLQKINDDAKLSDVANTVALNYGTYYECAVKNDAWIEWYEIQKRIFEEAGK